MSLTKVAGFVAGMFVLAIGMALAPQQATAVEQGQIRLGSDYDIFQTGGNDYRACERACNDDARCKAWTFLSNLGQCRLKHSVATKFENACCVSDVKREQRDTRADERQCSDYAVAALDDHNANLANRCGYRGPLWLTRFGEIFDRCLDISPSRRSNEAKQRSEALDDCRKLASRSQKLECYTVAKVAIQQAKSQASNNCGFNAANWHDSEARYVKACVNADRSARWDFLYRRESSLAACMSRGGGVADRVCDEYATRSVTQFRRAQQMRCGGGFAGLFWHANADDHYEWCRRASKAERERWLTQRQKQLGDCESDRRKGLRIILKF